MQYYKFNFSVTAVILYQECTEHFGLLLVWCLHQKFEEPSL